MPKAYGTPGPRILSPDCCTSESLAECSLGAQLLFDRLLVQSDDQGRQQADPAVIKATSFPLAADATPKRIATWMGELDRAGMVTLYRSGKVAIVQLNGWWKYQSGARRAYPSRWVAPDGWADRVFGVGKADPDDDAGNVPPDRPPTAGNVRAERGQPAPISPPHARGSGTSTSTVAVTGAGDARPDVMRHGLPHIDPETAAVLEEVTGMGMTTIHGWPAAELDRLCEQRTGERVRAAVRRVDAGAAETPSWEQLVGAIRADLEPPIHRTGKPVAVGKGFNPTSEEAWDAFGGKP